MSHIKRSGLALLLTGLLLGGCTTYTWQDGSRETVWGVPAEDDTKTRQERRQEGPRYRVPGEPPASR
ncbi:hypothetical protein OM427_19900 [Halomonas sp. 18H]|uniref:hypothetical protein n=1 Tax=Halomonas almeriensis TaxID=308163 RepID=UPI002231B779|nr:MULTISPECIES: hypothetical protein [Halomonas]MCW4151785.1 hypothetical protein [Halomonas sp. 18H]MDN3554031.1 hypothetical protein [Halomonas almeriensis]